MSVSFSFDFFFLTITNYFTRRYKTIDLLARFKINVSEKNVLNIMLHYLNSIRNVSIISIISKTILVYLVDTID